MCRSRLRENLLIAGGVSSALAGTSLSNQAYVAATLLFLIAVALIVAGRNRA